MNLKLVKTLGLATILAATAGTAQAVDTIGYEGPLASVLIYETSSDAYGTERGHLSINEGGGVLRKYQWGGQACNGRNLTEQNTNILGRVVASQTVKVKPYYKSGGGGVRCLVGFELQDTAVYIY